MASTLKPGEVTGTTIRRYEAQCCVCLTIIDLMFDVTNHGLTFQQATGWQHTSCGWCCPTCAEEIRNARQ